MLGLDERPRLAKKASTLGEGASEPCVLIVKVGYISRKNNIVAEEGSLHSRTFFHLPSLRIGAKRPFLAPTALLPPVREDTSCPGASILEKGNGLINIPIPVRRSYGSLQDTGTVDKNQYFVTFTTGMKVSNTVVGCTHSLKVSRECNGLHDTY